MKVDIKILNEIRRYNDINSYLVEQEIPAPPTGDLGAAVPPPPGGDLGIAPPTPGAEVGTPPPPPAPTVPEPVDVEKDPDVEKVGEEGKEKKIKVTDLVKGQESVEKKQEQYFENLFKHLDELESKLSNMDQIIDKLNSIETKIEKYRVKTPEEKLELRTLDSGPFNQKLTQYFEEKEGDFEETGKEQYILTPDEVESYSPNDIKKSFRNFENVDDYDAFNNSGYQKIY